MELITSPVFIQGVGWLGALFTVATFAMNSMIRLRLVVLASSLCFAIYGGLLQLWPILAVNLVLVPITAHRLWQIMALRKIVTHMTFDGEPDYSIAMVYGRKRVIPAGSVIFEKGDVVDSLYYLSEGSVEIEDQNVTVTEGKIFGEMAFFTGTETRTATVRSAEDSVVYELDKKRFARLQYEDPNFGMAVMSTITKRLVSNAAQSKDNA